MPRLPFSSFLSRSSLLAESPSTSFFVSLGIFRSHKAYFLSLEVSSFVDAICYTGFHFASLLTKDLLGYASHC